MGSSHPLHFAAPAVAGLALLAGRLARARPAHSFAEWCFDDPEVSIEGLTNSSSIQ